MPDTYSAEVRSRVMARVKGRDTSPEIALRRALWAIRVRGWRCHRTDLPGKPDLAFGRARVAVFVDGGFWHGHPNRYWQGRSGPYWDAKIARNQARDRRVDAELGEMDWTVVRLWDFEVDRDPVGAALRVRSFVGGSPRLSDPLGPLWTRMNQQPRLKPTGLVPRSVPGQPGVYAWYRRTDPVYVGKARDLEARVRGDHLGQGSSMTGSAFRRNAAAHLHIASAADIKAGRFRLDPSQVDRVNRWIQGCSAAWIRCRTEEEATSLEAAMKLEWLPPLTKR